MLLIAFDTATDVATSALVWDGEVLGELASQPRTVLEDVDALLRRGGVRPTQLEGVVVGLGPGSFTGLRMGIAAARALAFSLEIPAAGISTLAALAAGAPGALPVIDARRREVFTIVAGEPRAVPPAELELDSGAQCVGDGAVRYRSVLEASGAVIPPDDSELHIPRARHHAKLAAELGPPELLEPLYVRVPDAERASSSA